MRINLTMGQPQILNQAHYWIVTMSKDLADANDFNIQEWHDETDNITWTEGQVEKGASSGFLHYQFCFHSRPKLTKGQAKKLFDKWNCSPHVEPTRSEVFLNMRRNKIEC